MNLRKKFLIVGVTVLAMCGLVGCDATQESPNNQSTATEQKTNTNAQSLKIYCDDSMQKPLQEISDLFKDKTGTDVQVTFSSAAQIQSQIKTSQDGNFFIAGSEGDLKAVEEFVTEKKTLAKHIPVLAVQAGNPKGIHNLQDLTKGGIKIAADDPKSTQIGKIAQQAFIDEEIIDKINILPTTTQKMTTVLTMKEADAAINWKENCNVDDVEVVKTPDLEPYIKNIPIVRLKFDADNTVASEFEEFLDSDEAHNIWIKYDYEIED